MCDHLLGNLPCDNTAEHPGEGKGCTHMGLSGAHDAKTDEVCDD